MLFYKYQTFITRFVTFTKTEKPFLFKMTKKNSDLYEKEPFFRFSSPKKSKKVLRSRISAPQDKVFSSLSDGKSVEEAVLTVLFQLNGVGNQMGFDFGVNEVFVLFKQGLDGRRTFEAGVNSTVQSV